MDIRSAASFQSGFTPAAGSSSMPSAGLVGSSFGAGVSGQRSFAEALGDMRNADRFAAQETTTPEERARDAARKLVSTTLVEPILKQARENNRAAAPFAPTQAEKQFGSLLDHRLANDIVSASNFPIVERLAQDLLRKGGVTA